MFTITLSELSAYLKDGFDLLVAIRGGREDLVREIIGRSPTLVRATSCEGGGKSAVALAEEVGHLSIVEFLRGIEL